METAEAEYNAEARGGGKEHALLKVPTHELGWELLDLSPTSTSTAHPGVPVVKY
jgi:hypothetical protein